MLYQQRNDFGVREFTLTKTQLAVNRFAGSQNIARRQLHLGEQFSKLRLRKWFDVVVDLLKRNATLPEQLVQFATFRSSWLFVNGNAVCHRCSPLLLREDSPHPGRFRHPIHRKYVSSGSHIGVIALRGRVNRIEGGAHRLFQRVVDLFL